jgi:crotonobetainyl-CoA:carnitine CoA-transferase CaiB-like acyl-CoA transferase
MQAFDGIRILDFTHVFAGPFATSQLGLMGAEVIKIESPHDPDMMRCDGADEKRNEIGLGLNYIANNQGKKAICLDLSQSEGQKIARQLIATADVLVQNYAHGLDRHNLGSEQALKINPTLIYCSMSGFGSDNPFSGRPAYDAVIQAFSGMMSVNGEPAQQKLRVGPPLIDYGTGAQTAFAIAAALFQRSRTGKGQVIDVNMLDAALVMMTPFVLEAIHCGKTGQRTGNEQTHHPGHSIYACSDDAIMVGAYTLRQHRGLFDALNLGDLMLDPEQQNYAWLRDNGDQLRQRIQQCLKTETADYWEDYLNSRHVPAARVRDLYQMLQQEQLRRASASRHQRLGDNSLTAPIAAFGFATDGPEFNDYCARHGDDTFEVLGELGVSAEQLQALRQSGVV